MPHRKSVLLLALLLSLLSSWGSTGYAQNRPQFTAPAQFQRVDQAFSSLPKPHSSEWDSLVSRIQEAMSGGKEGWVKLDLKEYLPEPVFDSLFSVCPIGSICVGNEGPFRGQYQTWDAGGINVWLEEPATQTLEKLTDWIQDLVRTAVPAEFDRFRDETLASYRIIAGGTGVAVENWHADGARINATLALKGGGTEVMPKGSGGKSFQLAQGELFLFSGNQRPGFAPTIHRSPSGPQDRLLLVLRIY